MSLDRRRLGAVGEDAAAAWYRAAGYQVLDRNWRCAEGEIDLVCRRGGTVVVCEVKTRGTPTFGSPFEAVTVSKRRRLRGLGARWLREHEVRCVCVRFDVAGVIHGRVEVIEGAF
ncbi:MAG: YraN family protein [Acidimicrobiales bacterium]